jgi:hypothetical protein
VKLAPLIVTFAWTAAGLALACSGSSAAPKPPGGDGGVIFETLLQRSIPGQPGDRIQEAARDQAAWKALWDRLREGENGILPADPPPVDFTHDMVIVAAMPNQPCVSKVTIRKVTRTGGTLIVDLLEAPPAPNCTCFVSERPLHVIRLPKSEGPVRFEVEQGVTSCG